MPLRFAARSGAQLIGVAGDRAVKDTVKGGKAVIAAYASVPHHGLLRVNAPI